MIRLVPPTNVSIILMRCCNLSHRAINGLTANQNLFGGYRSFFGVDRVSAPQLANPKSDVDQCRSLAEIVVLDDAALGFRDHSSSWPVSITNPQPTTWVVLKCARPVVRGALWEHLTRHFAERLIVIMAVEDLRDSEVQISNQLSWERTAQDLFWELTYNPRVNGASSCAHTVVSFGTSGAFLLSRRTEPHETIDDNDLASLSGRLFFDPEVGESGWEGDRPGNMVGNTTALRRCRTISYRTRIDFVKRFL